MKCDKCGTINLNARRFCKKCKDDLYKQMEVKRRYSISLTQEELEVVNEALSSYLNAWNVSKDNKIILKKYLTKLKKYIIT